MSKPREKKVATTILTRLTSDSEPSSFIKFGKIIESTVPAKPNAPPMKYKRIPISRENPDGSTGDLVVCTLEDLFSFGVAINTNPGSDVPNGHTLSICLETKGDPKEEEREWISKFDEIIQCCRNYIFKNRAELGQPDLSKAEVKRINPLYIKKVNGKPVEGQGPVLYAKLIEKKPDKNDPKSIGKILSRFSDKSGNPVDPLDPEIIFGKYCKVTVALKIESIYVGGGKNSIQIKVHDAIVEPLQSSFEPLLNKRPKGLQSVLTGNAKTLDDIKYDEEEEEEKETPKKKAPKKKKKKEEEDETGSIKGDEETPEEETPEEEEPKKKVKKVPIKRKGD